MALPYSKIGRWVAELILVFVGVYAAFWLNNFQQHHDESVIRWGLSRMARYQKLSDELIVPNLDHDISFFYDPVTKRLRKRFEIYPEALEATVKFANDLERTHTALLRQIQAERHR